MGMAQGNLWVDENKEKVEKKGKKGEEREGCWI